MTLSDAIFAALVAAVALFGLAPWWLERRRDAGYGAYCEGRGYQYVARRDGAEKQYADLVPIFHVGAARHWRHEMSGIFRGLSFTALEYTYRSGGGRSATYSRHAMVRWELPAANLPKFNVLPSDFFYFAGLKRPDSTVSVPSDPGFSAQFIAVGDPALLERILTPELRAAMTSRSDNHLAGSGPVLFWWLDVKLPGPAGVDALLEMAERFSRLVLSSGG